MVERQLASEGTGRLELGREKFLERMWDFMEETRPVIMGQQRRLGIDGEVELVGRTLPGQPRDPMPKESAD